MGFIRPSAPQYKPELDLQVAGRFVARCCAVRQGLANRAYPNGRPHIAIDFAIDDPAHKQLKGKRAGIVCAESIYRDPETRRESFFLGHCRSMGYPNPEQGVDPDWFIGRWFIIEVEQGEGRVHVRRATLIPTPAHAAATSPPTSAPGDNPDAGPDPGADIPF